MTKSRDGIRAVEKLNLWISLSVAFCNTRFEKGIKNSAKLENFKTGIEFGV